MANKEVHSQGASGGKSKSKNKNTKSKKDGRLGKYQCGGCGCTHKTKEALHNCKK